MNKEGFLILLELCTVYFAFQYAAIFDPAAMFQARRLLVVTDGRMVVVDGGGCSGGFQKSLILLKILSDEVHNT